MPSMIWSPFSDNPDKCGIGTAEVVAGDFDGHCEIRFR